MLTLDPASLIMCSPEDAHLHEAQRPPARHPELLASPPPCLRSSAPKPAPTPDLLDGTSLAFETEAATLTLGPDGIARVRMHEGRWVNRIDIVAILDWLDTYCPSGTPLLIDKRRPYALDFSAQQAVKEALQVPAAAILIPTLNKVPLAEYSRETYMRRIATRIFRSETHALRWLSTFLDDVPYLPAHDLIQPPDALDLDG